MDLATRFAAARGRPDLARRLGATIARLTNPTTRLVVAGEYKKGKSALVNLLVTAPVCPVDDDVATCVPTLVGFGPEPSAVVVLGGTGAEGLTREPVEPSRIAEYATEAGNPGNERGVRWIEVRLPRQLLAPGLELVDTPGVGGLWSGHAAATLAALPLADALLFVTDASQELTAPELSFLRQAADLCPNVLCVLTKADVFPEWRTILELDRGHLAGAGIPAPVIAVGSGLRHEAIGRADRALNELSGFPLLLDQIQAVTAGGLRLTLRSTAHDVLSVIAQLEHVLAAERQALSGAGAEAALAAARDRAARLREQTAGWQQTLNDGVTDLTTEVEYDLRRRTRALLREAEEAVDRTDPASSWQELERWLKQTLAEQVSENRAVLVGRAAELAEGLAARFEAELSLPTLDDAPPAAAETAVLAEMQAGPRRIGSRGLLALRSAYGGAALFGSLGSLAGLAILNPVTLVLGILLGGKALRDQARQQITARRQQAKAAVKRFVDDATLAVTKDAKDAVRLVQRELRDRSSTLVAEVQRSAVDAVAAAEDALRQDAAERARRLAAVEEDLKNAAALRARVGSMLGPPGS